MYTVCQETSHLWFAITLIYVSAFWYFFGRNVTDKVNNQKTLYYTTPNNLCFFTTWKNGETRKSHFFTQMLYQCIARIQLVAPWFLQSFDSWLILTLLYDYLNLVINMFSSGLLGNMVQEKGSRQHCSSRTVLHAQCMCTCALSSWKKKNVICDAFDSVWHLLR